MNSAGASIIKEGSFRFNNGKDEYYKVKIITLGNQGVGKGSIIKCYCDKEVGLPSFSFQDYYQKKINKDNLNLKVTLMYSNISSNGQKFLFQRYLEKALGFIFVYDVTNRKSFEDLLTLIRDFPTFKQGSDLAVRMLIANKSDLYDQRQVTFYEGQQLADTYGFLFYETSALKGGNVHKSIDHLIDQIIDSSLFRVDSSLNCMGYQYFPQNSDNL